MHWSTEETGGLEVIVGVFAAIRTFAGINLVSCERRVYRLDALGGKTVSCKKEPIINHHGGTEVKLILFSGMCLLYIWVSSC